MELKPESPSKKSDVSIQIKKHLKYSKVKRMLRNTSGFTQYLFYLKKLKIMRERNKRLLEQRATDKKLLDEKNKAMREAVKVNAHNLNSIKVEKASKLEQQVKMIKLLAENDALKAGPFGFWNQDRVQKLLKDKEDLEETKKEDENTMFFLRERVADLERKLKAE